jgi:CRISPR-associated protein Cas2
MADQMWVLVMFDLPVKTKMQRRAASRYRNMLLDMGFSMSQLSVYSKYLINGTGLLPILPAIKASVPPDGEVRVIRLTDDQWAGMYRFYGERQLGGESKPTQLALFDDDENSGSDDDFL